MRTPAEHLAKFHDTVAILVKAYLNDTLVHEQCTACAVGNLIAHGCGYLMLDRYNDDFEEKEFCWVDEHGGSRVAYWRHLFVCDGGDGDTYQSIYPNMYDADYVKHQVDATGYKWENLALIEKAFERVTYRPTASERAMSRDERMFVGLMDVISVLASIHGVDLETTEAARKMFVKV